MEKLKNTLTTEKKLKIVKNLFKKKTPLDVISKVTGLVKSKLETLK